MHIFKLCILLLQIPLYITDICSNRAWKDILRDTILGQQWGKEKGTSVADTGVGCPLQCVKLGRFFSAFILGIGSKSHRWQE